MEKRCNRCKELKTADSFYKNRSRKDGLSGECRSCNKEYNQKRYQDPKVRKLMSDLHRQARQDPEIKERRYAAARLWRNSPTGRGWRYGLTAEEYLSLVGDGMCDVGCGRTGTDVDHDHSCCPRERSCGKCVRGWLCRMCNQAEGFLRTPETARALADYMERTAVRSSSQEEESA